jgi:hypothetical protein
LVNAILAANRDFSTLADKRFLAAANQKEYFLQNELLFWQNCLMVSNEGTLRTRLCDEYHRPLYQAHPERKKMREIMLRQYAWPGLGVFINRYYGNCPECRRSRNIRLKPAGLLQLLPILERVWQHITMNFKSFPLDQNDHDAILVVIDRLAKRSFSLPTRKTCTAAELADLYFMHIWRIYETPETITSDRNSQFIAKLFRKFAKLIEIILQPFIAEHAQTNDQTEIINQFIQTKLRPFVNYFQND